MGIIQSLYITLMGYVPVTTAESISRCHICDKEIESYVARESDGKTSWYFCNWPCYKQFTDRRIEERKKRESETAIKYLTYTKESLNESKESKEFSRVEETDYKGEKENPLHTFPPGG